MKSFALHALVGLRIALCGRKTIMPHAEYARHLSTTTINPPVQASKLIAFNRGMNAYPEDIHCYCFDHKVEKLRSFRESRTASINAFYVNIFASPRKRHKPIPAWRQVNKQICKKRTSANSGAKVLHFFDICNTLRKFSGQPHQNFDFFYNFFKFSREWLSRRRLFLFVLLRSSRHYCAVYIITS